jgi:hypothetical protein
LNAEPDLPVEDREPDVWESLVAITDIPGNGQIAICMLLECSPDDILGVADPSTYDLTDG